MVALPIPLSTSPGTRPQESAGRLVNCFAEPLGEEKGFKIIRAPGLTSFATVSGVSGFRGMFLSVATLYVAYGDTLFRVTSAGGPLTLIGGGFSGTLPVQFAANNRSPTPDKVVVTENGAFIFTDTTISAYPDLDLPVPAGVTSIDGYLVFPIADGRCFASELNSTSVNALSFGKAEYKPDGLTRAVAWAGRLYLFGSETTEVWQNTGAAPFPFERIAIFPKGLIAKTAVTGFENGFSQDDVGFALAFVGNDNAVHMVSGYATSKISPPDLDTLIEAVTDKSTIEMGCFVVRGHPMLAVSCASWSWVFDLNTKKWHERASYGIARWRGKFPHYAFDKWLVGDSKSTTIYRVNSTAYTEGGEPLRYRVETGLAKKFPDRVQVARIQLDMVTGVGIAAGAEPQETDPTVEISISHDGGVNWTAPRFAKLGRQAVASGRIVAHRFGLSRSIGPRVRVDVNDPVYASLSGVDVVPEVRPS